MSSMLKKTGGLAFKPKALGRRGGPASTPSSSQAPTAATSSSNATRAPTTEPLQPTVDPPSLTPPATNPSGQDVAPAVNVEQTATGLAGTKPVDGLPPTPEPTQASATPSNPKSTSRRQSQVAASTSEPNTASDAEVQNQVSEAVATSTAERRPYPGESRAGASTSRVRPDIPTASDAPEAAASSQSSEAPAVTAVTTSQDPAAPVAQSKKKRSYTRRKPQATAVDGAETSTAVDGTAAIRKRARSQGRKRTARTAGESGPDAPAGIDDETSATPKPSKRRRRSLTPEDAVNIKVDHTAVKMSELTRDLGIGVPFKHANAIAERAREARNQARLRKLEKDKIRKGLLPDPGDDIHGSHKRDAEHGATKSRLGSSAPDGGNGQAETAGPGYIVVDGQIIINQQSLMIDNHASAEDMSMMRTVVEDDFTHLTTSASFMRASRVMGANSWTEDETEKFYNYLRMFGTDFETISHMFPGKNRRMVKLKFNREERQRPNRINAAVMARDGRDVSIDLDHYKEKRSNWQEADEIKKEHDALVAEHNVEVQRLKAERRAQGLVDDDDDDGNNDLKNTSKENGIVDGDADAVDKTADGGDTGSPAEADAADEQDGDLPDLARADNIEHTSAAITAVG